MKTITDSQLIVLYQNGDENALGHLISRHQKEIYTFIFYKVLDEDLANDIFQDAFMKAIVVLKEKRYNETGKFVLWLKRIAHNLIIDHFRLKSKRVLVSGSTAIDKDFTLFDFIPETSDNIEDSLVKTQIIQDLYRMIAFLPENQKEIIKLRYFDNLSFKEIAEQTNSSINTTLGRVRYALINLRKIMDEHKIGLTLE
ncbi:MAG: sigma-70 family RNA polymerase sigma factor [Bacteroidetes bacterium]|nr:sigma-70 family RNA polymerase sigma factor [Bacteroidota bacterium]